VLLLFVVGMRCCLGWYCAEVIIHGSVGGHHAACAIVIRSMGTHHSGWGVIVSVCDCHPLVAGSLLSVLCCCYLLVSQCQWPGLGWEGSPIEDKRDFAFIVWLRRDTWNVGQRRKGGNGENQLTLDGDKVAVFAGDGCGG
jgi:hypothetical protein